MWPSAKRISHWSLMNMEERTDFLREAYRQIYQRYYPLLSWYVHSGITGVTTPTGEGFANLCGMAYTIASECYALILESIVDEFGLQKADEKLKTKIQFARMLPYADTSQQVDELICHASDLFAYRVTIQHTVNAEPPRSGMTPATFRAHPPESRRTDTQRTPPVVGGSSSKLHVGCLPGAT